MPSLSRLLEKLSHVSLGEPSGQQQRPLSFTSQNAPADQSTMTTHHISTPLPMSFSPQPAISQTPPPWEAPMPIPPGALLFTLTHPDPNSSPATAFFLTCLPDPIGFLHHCVPQIMSYLSLQFPSPPSRGYRHQSISLVLDPAYDGLAATSGGEIRVSLDWVAKQKGGHREVEDVTKEFKGVLLHELVHALQRDGGGSAPSWLTESVADWIRLKNGLGPRHWKKCGEGKREKGWETGYDVGAWFLDYLVGGGKVGGLDYIPANSNSSGAGRPQPPPPTSSTVTGQAPPPQPTQYNVPPSQIENAPAPYPKPQPIKPRVRPPIPDLVKQIDHRLEVDRYHDGWWSEMAGAPLDMLWREYLDHYS